MTEPVPAYVRKATFIEAHDGDTATFALDHGAYPSSRAVTEAVIRVKDLYCPELSQAGGAEAGEFTRGILARAARITVQTYKGSFARTVGDVWVDGRLLADVVIEAGHGTRTA